MDLATGCNYWTYTAPREVRTAITVAHADGQDGPLAVFADTANTLFVVDATTGEERWQADVDSHPLATSTGSPVVHDNRIYVPVSSGEVSAAGRPDYHCCTFRGNVAAFDLGSGERVWLVKIRWVIHFWHHRAHQSGRHPVWILNAASCMQAPVRTTPAQHPTAVTQW